MTATRSSRNRSAETDWVNDTVLGALPTPEEIRGRRESVHQSSHELENGLEVKELDTIPGEFLDIFDQIVTGFGDL